MKKFHGLWIRPWGTVDWETATFLSFWSSGDAQLWWMNMKMNEWMDGGLTMKDEFRLPSHKVRRKIWIKPFRAVFTMRAYRPTLLAIVWHNIFYLHPRVACRVQTPRAGRSARGQNLFSSVGEHNSPDLELRIVDKHLRPVSLGQQGAIQLRGDVVFSGYYNYQIATKDCTTQDGWIETSDVGSLDENKQLEIVGRNKEILILNGNKEGGMVLG